MSSQPISVSGGAASIAADCDDMITSARLMAPVAGWLADQAASLQADLLGGVSTASLVDPDGAIRFETALLGALDGPHGLAVLALKCEALRLALESAARAYLAADRLRTDLTPYVEVASGSWRYLTDIAVTALGGKLTMAEVALLYPDGHAVLTPTGVDRSVAAAGPPRSVKDLIENLAHRNQGADGEISVQILKGTDANGQAYRKVIVDVPGTKDWNAQNLDDTDVANIGTNARAMAGERTTYENGVIAALKAAGVQPSDDVTIVGHSLGGTIAVNTARDLVAQGQHVTHVITAGAPISKVVADLPHSVQVLAIENADDLVPHLDGSPNPDLGNVTTVTVNHPQATVIDNHDLDKSYVPGAADVDAAADPSTTQYLAGLQQQLSATSSTTYTYVVTRGFS